MNVRVKICGINEPNIAKALSTSAVDAIGLVFYPPSPRVVDIKKAQQIIDVLPPFINRVGLFVNAKTSVVEHILKHVPLDTLQFSGREAPKDCTRYGLPYIKSIAMDEKTDLSQMAEQHQNASALLLDYQHPTLYGGSGERFDWSLLDGIKLNVPMILAGGLNADNVVSAITQVKPYGVDVSSGVESTKGVKDIDKILCFSERAKQS